MKEYVIARAIPIPELLCAFDIYLVGRRKFAEVSIYSTPLTSAKSYKRRSQQPWHISCKWFFRESERNLLFMLTDFDVPEQAAVA